MTAGEQPPVFSFRCSRRASPRLGLALVLEGHGPCLGFRLRLRLQACKPGSDSGRLTEPLAVPFIPSSARSTARAPSGPRRRRARSTVGAERGERGARQRLHARDADEVGGAQAAAEARRAARRQHVVRAGGVVAGGLRRPGRRRRSCRPSSSRAAVAASSTTRCSGARRLASAIDSRSLRVRTIAPRRRSASRAGPSAGACASTWRCTAVASRLLEVIRIARASTSCSACASRSAAIQAGLPARRDDHDLARAGVEVDAAVPRDQRLGRRDVGVAGADDLVHARHAGRAVGHRRDGVRAAEAEQPRRRRLRAPRPSPWRPAAGSTRSLPRRRRRAPESPSSAATRAADSVRRARSSRRARAA